MLGFYASLIEPFRLVITEWTVSNKSWNYQKPLKIVLLTDTHAIYPWMTKNHLDKIV
jgi:predicted MPP superfamily phosphohydrolase